MRAWAGPWSPSTGGEAWRAPQEAISREESSTAGGWAPEHPWQPRMRHEAPTRPRSPRAEDRPRRDTVADQLIARAASHGGRRSEGSRERHRKRSHRRDSRSKSPRRRRRSRSTTSGSAEERLFREARGSQGSSVRTVAQRAPGRLLESCLARMEQYLGRRQGDREVGRVASVFTPYLSSVLLPTLGEGASLRNTNELHNLAMALDFLMDGDIPRACDVLAQRFKAVELASQDGSWNVARHVQLAGDMRVSSLTQREKEAATVRERNDIKFKAMAKGSH